VAATDILAGARALFEAEVIGARPARGAGSLVPVIRPLDIGDRTMAERLLEIQHAAYAVEAELIGFDAIPPLQEDLAGLMSSTEHWLGRYDGNVLVGAVAYELPNDETVEISRMIVDPAHARRGHGRALLDHLDQLEPRPVSIVSTGTANTPAVSLYKSRGYTETGRLEGAPGVQLTQFQRRRVR
jgi:ribosomal protein S18 acetylase RimI-like enzyme